MGAETRQRERRLCSTTPESQNGRSTMWSDRETKGIQFADNVFETLESKGSLKMTGCERDDGQERRRRELMLKQRP